MASVVINEVVSSNHGTSVDEVGETDDWIEIINTEDHAVNLAAFEIADSSGRSGKLPGVSLRPREVLVLWADDSPGQGDRHLPFRLSASGERLTLRDTASGAFVELTVPKLAQNESLARFPDGTGNFARCRYSSPGRSNGESCSPAAAPSLSSGVGFTDYELPQPYPELTGPVVISEAALRPAHFIELANVSAIEQSLTGLNLRIAGTAPGEEYPGPETGVRVPLPSAASLAPGHHLALTVEEVDVLSELGEPLFEGVVTLFDADGEPMDRWDFLRWPSNAALTRFPEGASHPIFCGEVTPGEPNTRCGPITTREVGDRVRHLRTPGDFSALAEGAATLGMAPVKFVYDMQQGGALHLLSSRAWPLHYTFVREVIDREPPLDRCDPAQNAQFRAGWYAFSQTEYYQPEGRRYLLGTLVHHGGADLHTVEYALGDTITAQDMRRGFFAVISHVMDPAVWWLRPQDETQAETALEADGTLPILAPSAPFNGVSYQALATGIGYGTLRYIAAADLPDAALGPETIVVTDDVPNDIALVGGLITEAFQTPLAHVNVLSQSRGTPNMALVGARTDPRLTSYLDTLVRLEVRGDGFSISAADPGAAEAYWESLRPSGTLQSPRLDLDVRGVVPLSEAGFEHLPAIGAKAAQFAELGHVRATLPSACSTASAWTAPIKAFAIPVVHFVEHFRSSGAEAVLASLQADIGFRSNPEERRAGLDAVQQAIQRQEVDPELLRVVEAAVRDRFGVRRVRFRSSSNAEDLQGFNGAGLYSSTSVQLGSDGRSIEDGLRLVWASLYGLRAYDERELAGIDHSAVAMGVLVHEAFLSERANGVAISRNILDPIRSDIYYMNTQIGEASVTNPAPGVVTEELIYRWPPRFPSVTYQARSSLSPHMPVLSEEEVVSVACALYSIDAHFSALLNPDGSDPWFAMETEFKFIGSERRLLIKQARPHSFGKPEIIGDCREI